MPSWAGKSEIELQTCEMRVLCVISSVRSKRSKNRSKIMVSTIGPAF